MNIQGLDYNTQREKLIMSEYGREIQKMVDHAVSLKDKAERQRCAQAIIHQMELRNPQVRESVDYERTLWDHLFLMSRKALDIDWPFDVAQAEAIHAKPQPLPLPNGHIRQRHYGSMVEQLFERLKTMPDNEERRELVRITANQMKRDLALWGHGSMDDERVANDLARFTDGVIQLDLGSFKFSKVSVTADEPAKKTKKRK